MVGHGPLKASIGVRIPAPQSPNFPKSEAIGWKFERPERSEGQNFQISPRAKRLAGNLSVPSVSEGYTI